MRKVFIASLLCLFLLGCGASDPIEQENASKESNERGTLEVQAAIIMIFAVVLIGVLVLASSKFFKISDIVSELKKQLVNHETQLKMLKEDNIRYGNIISSLRADQKKHSSLKSATGDWDRLQKGMREAEVTEILGQPKAILPTHDGDMYVYGENRLAGMVSFISGQVSSYQKPGVDKNLLPFEEPNRGYRESLKTETGSNTEDHQSPKQE